nr:MAG TPA: hypothetical protein [Caudoviricetes sp.]
MEEKKRKGYKTQEQQNEANKRYRATEEGKKNTKHSTYKSRARVFINEMAKLEELEELEILIKNKKMEVLKMKELKKIYAEWRKVSEEMLEEGFKGSVDCGDKAVREDFSNYAELQETISFEEMLELEKEYNKNN